MTVKEPNCILLMSVSLKTCQRTQLYRDDLFYYSHMDSVEKGKWYMIPVQWSYNYNGKHDNVKVT